MLLISGLRICYYIAAIFAKGLVNGYYLPVHRGMQWGEGCKFSYRGGQHLVWPRHYNAKTNIKTSMIQEAI